MTELGLDMLEVMFNHSLRQHILRGRSNDKYGQSTQLRTFFKKKYN